ncbi:MAG: DpnD/PcfM family protein [Sedimentibacter sp.]
MLTFKFEITETLQRVMTIEAENENEAYERVSDMYRNCEIILSSEDFFEYEINLID